MLGIPNSGRWATQIAQMLPFWRLLAAKLGFSGGSLGWDGAAKMTDEKRNTERILLTIPIRVTAFGGSEGGFSEATYTVEVNQDGARIALKHQVEPGDTIRIVNLENLREADFRVVGPRSVEEGGITDWGVVCLEANRNLWDIKFSAPLKAHANEAGALLTCETCGAQSFCSLRDWEIESLEAGSLQKFCENCGSPTNWHYANRHGGIEEGRPPEPPPQPETITAKLPPGTFAHKRAHKRLAMKLSILVRDKNGAEEVSKTECLSKGGLAVSLALKLEVGDVISVYCPYCEAGQNFEQKAEVRSRLTFFQGERWIYGLRYVVREKV